MPDPATVTTFHDFAGGRRAFADHVDHNFQMVGRGHHLPIDPNTAATATNTYDHGATDAQWRTAYYQQAPYINGVQANRFEIQNIYDGSVPTELVDAVGDLERIAFPADRDTDVRMDFEVTPWYKPGNRIGLEVHGYPETTGSTVFYLTSRLYKPGTTTITGTSTPAAVLTTTVVLPNASGGLLSSITDLKFTDANGLINGVTVTVGDRITAQLKRAATNVSDTNTGKWFAVGLFCQLNN